METIRYAEIPVEILWEYAEVKRDEAVSKRSTSIGSVTSSESYEVINYSEPLQLSVVGTNALITHGGNRIKAAMESGCKHILVNVSVFLGDGKKLFFNNTLNRFKPINSDLALCLKKIFL